MGGESSLKAKELPTYTYLRIYLLGLALATALIVLVSISTFQLTIQHIFVVLVFSIFVAVADFFPIIIRSGESEITTSVAFRIASVILFPFPLPIFIAFFGTSLGEVWLARDWYKKVFNVTMVVVVYAILVAAYAVISDGDSIPLNSVADILAVLFIVLAGYILNSIMVSLVVALSRNDPFSHVWQRNYSDVSLHHLMSAPLGAAFALLWNVNPLTSVLVVAPLFIVRSAFKFMTDLRRQTKEALLALADALDARDRSTSQHSARVSQYARRIAVHLNLGASEVETITTAARLHDLGKIGIDNRYLYKPSSLSPEEERDFRRHPTIGAEITERFPLFEQGSKLIHRHHEHYNGKGYPDGLAGEEIPLGSRILAVADAYDAMTSDRPYREAMSSQQALQTLVEKSGTQFDPRVVRAFQETLDAQGPLPAPGKQSPPEVSS